MKHAIMIMAHANFDALCRLICLLDSEGIDIFLHINRLSTDWDEKMIDGLTKFSDIILAPRVKVTYCNYSQVDAIKSLLTCAMKGNYDYYHIISGADLPLHPMSYFKSFFEKHPGKEFVNFEPEYDITRAYYRHFFPNTIRTSSGLKQKLFYHAYKYLIKIQKALKVNLAKGYQGSIHKGADWWSITHRAAEYVLSQEPTFKKYFRYTYCPSELLVQTTLYNSPFRDRIYSLKDEPIAALREIDWQRGQPYVWRTEDYEQLIASQCMFARKFDVKVDSEIISKIINHIKQQ